MAITVTVKQPPAYGVRVAIWTRVFGCNGLIITGQSLNDGIHLTVLLSLFKHLNYKDTYQYSLCGNSCISLWNHWNMAV